jgi:hypothetical protein
VAGSVKIGLFKYCHIGMLQVDLPHSWDTLENASIEFEFCERNTFDILKEK